MVQKIDLTTGGMTTAYQYTTAGNKWVNFNTSSDATVGELVLAAGEAMCVYNGDTAGSDLAFQFSGAVELNPISLNIPPSNYSLVGNFTPVSVDLTAVVPKGADGTDLGTSKKKIMVQKITAATGGMGTAYQYTTAGNKWVNFNTSSDVVAGEVVLAPGESLCVYNGDTKTVSLKFPSPISE